MKIISQIKERGAFKSPSNFTDEDISNEPMFYRASFDFAYKNGGVLTRRFLDNLPDDWKNIPLTIDSRSHMLMDGWYTGIPGFHHDDIPRSRIDGQPNYINPEYNAEHIMGLVNSHVSPTEFALGEIELDIPGEGKVIYKEWHKEVQSAIDQNKLESYFAKDYTYTEFNCHSFHQGTRSTGSGWRWFIRLSRNTDRANNCKNEIRKQVQVYLEFPMEGW